MRLLFILNKAYEQDPRAQRELKAVLDQGHTAEVLTFRDRNHPPPVLPGAAFHVFPLQRRRNLRARYALEYSLYLFWAGWQAVMIFLRRRYQAVQVFLLPEPLFFACLVPRLLGVKVIADWMDLGFELYDTKYHPTRWDPVPRILHAAERAITALSHVILIPNASFESALRGRCPGVKNCRVVMNTAVSTFFKIRRVPESGSVRLLYTGTLSKRNGLQVLIEAFARASAQMPGLALTILGAPIDTDAEVFLREMRTIRGIRFAGQVKHAEVLRYISNADIGIIPSSDTPFTRINLPTRLFEYGAAVLPVICSDLPGIRTYFDATELAFCKPDDPAALTDCIRSLALDEHKRRRYAIALHARMREFSWDKVKAEYLTIVSSLDPATAKVAGKRIRLLE